MNVIKFGRGDFFGIIIPGAFLVLNLVLLFPDEASEVAQQVPADWSGQDAIIGVGLVVVSYMLGFALRVVRPSYLEVIGYPLQVIDIFFKPLLQLFGSKDGNARKVFWNMVRQKARDYWQPFPYIRWLYSSYINECPESYRMFFMGLLEHEYGGDEDRMKGHTFVNQCKIVILRKSKALADEVMFSEGLVRFLSGMTCALIFGLIVAIARGGAPLVVWGYLLLVVLFLKRLRFIRFKEVATVFTAFACLGGISRENRREDQHKISGNRDG